MKRFSAITGLLLAAPIIWSLAAGRPSPPASARGPAVDSTNRSGPVAARTIGSSAPAAASSSDRVEERTAEYPRLWPVEPFPAQPGTCRRLPPVSAVSPAFWSDSELSYAQPSQLAGPRPPEELVVPALDPDVVTLHLDEVDVRQAFELLSRSYGVNVLVAPSVKGLVTANFEQVSVDQAIQSILKLCDLVAVREGNLLYVYSAEDYPQADQLVRVFALDFVSAQDLMPAVQGLLSLSGQAFVTQVSADDNRRTQEAIMVSDMPSRLGRIEQYVLQMDQPPRQVVIEAHVLEIELGSGCRHGIDYEALLSMAGGDIELDVVGFANPAASPAAFARLKGGDLDSLLHILKTTTDAKTLASPRLMVVNGQKARLQVGEQLGYKVVTITETAAVEEVKFLDVGIVLEVTPRISRDNRVMLHVWPKVSTGDIDPVTELPEEETSEIQTDVLLVDGEGVVIGGLIQEKDIDLETKLPVLGEIPVVGWLFRKWEKTKRRTETIITLVPRVCVVDPEFETRSAIDAERSRTPLLHGPLERYPRPWEPVLPGTAHNPYPLWNKERMPSMPSLNLKSAPSMDWQFGSSHCDDCDCETCICPHPDGNMQPIPDQAGPAVVPNQTGPAVAPDRMGPVITPDRTGPVMAPDRAHPMIVPVEEPELRCSRLRTYRY